jgi:hypothetical protein
MPGIQFQDAASILATVTDNGIDPADPRVMIRVNDATKIILDTIRPVGSMITVQFAAMGTTLLLPKEMENAVDVQVVTGKVRNQSDITQGFYSLINNSDYVDPSLAMDNPLVDQGLVADPADITGKTLRRQYDYPGLTPNSVVQVTGDRRYVPITQTTDTLIVQNIEALKLIILSIERNENNAPQEAMAYRQQGFELLQAEVKKHLLDPNNMMKRKSKYEDDLVNFPFGSMAWTRARIALEVPNAMQQGKQQLTRILEMAEWRLMEKGMWRGTLKEYSAQVVGGYVYFPKDVFSILAVDLDGYPIDLRNQFSEFQENGPGMRSYCHPALVDKGEELFPASGNTRRKFLLHASGTTPSHINVIAKIRWIAKQPADQMTIKCYEALRLMSQGIVKERNEKWQEAVVDTQMAVQAANDDLTDYLRGMKFTPTVQTHGFSMQSGGPL